MTQPTRHPPTSRPRRVPRPGSWCLALAALTLVAGLAACAGNGAGPAGTPAASTTAPVDAYPPPGTSAVAGKEPGAPYPPPRTPAPAVPTTAVEADGYRALPLAVDSNVVTLDKAPQAEFLRQLQAQLDAGDAAGLANSVRDRGSLVAGPNKNRHTAYFYGLEFPETQAILRQLFDAGSRPRIEGVHVEDSGSLSDCLAIITSGWRGTVYLRPTPPAPTPVATDAIGLGPDPTELVVDGGEHRWDVCRTDSGWTQWQGWWWGGYDDLIADLQGVNEDHPYLAVRPVGATRTITVTDAGSAIALDIPAGWPVYTVGPTIVVSFNRLDNHGDLPHDLTKVDIYPESTSLDEIEADLRQPRDDPDEAVAIKELVRQPIGPNRYPALYAVVDGAGGGGTLVAIDVGGKVYRLSCYGDCTGLKPIAETIRPAGATP